MRPKSSSETFIWRKSIARTVPSVTSSSYVLPVRLSVTVSVSCALAPLCAAPAWCSVPVLMHLSMPLAGLEPVLQVRVLSAGALVRDVDREEHRRRDEHGAHQHHGPLTPGPGRERGTREAQ